MLFVMKKKLQIYYYWNKKYKNLMHILNKYNNNNNNNSYNNKINNKKLHNLNHN